MVCASVMAVVLWFLSRWLNTLLHGASDLLQLSVCVTAGAAVYGISAYVLKLPELITMLQILARKKDNR
jgi:hypothetical protein